MKENANDDNIEIVLSSIIHSRDNDSKGKINETNRKLENLCKGKGLILIKHWQHLSQQNQITLE